jgi:hypothetical protein
MGIEIELFLRPLRSGSRVREGERHGGVTMKGEKPLRLVRHERGNRQDEGNLKERERVGTKANKGVRKHAQRATRPHNPPTIEARPMKRKRLLAKGKQRTRVRATVTPPGPGTVGLLAEYGPRLLFVRYRYDAPKKRRYKTAEIIVDEVYWEPPRKKKQRSP